ncbi:transformer-2 sex-determining protein-like isoform X2 [Convolutriloba macropyga]|uniref:transformer-2 sex-determining protein-like isoform X2 n=1 Tax=Convolutriloba macropyga TaxID=536237 RepID=UPI003F520469
MPRRSRSRSPVSRSRSRSREYRRERSPSDDRRRRRSRSRSHGRRAEKGGVAPSKCLGVFGLNERTTERDIEKFFGDYTGYMNCKLIKDYMSDRNRGFGFINFETQDDATYVRDRCNGKELHGRIIRVEYSLSQRATTPTPGMYFGVRARDERGDAARPYRERRGGYGGGGGGYGGRDRRDYRSRSRSRSPYYRRR